MKAASAEVTFLFSPIMSSFETKYPFGGSSHVTGYFRRVADNEIIYKTFTSSVALFSLTFQEHWLVSLSPRLKQQKKETYELLSWLNNTTPKFWL